MQRGTHRRRPIARAVLACLSLVVASCGADSTPPAAGKQLFVDQGCIACHSENLQGTKLGPSLADAAAHWKVQDLVVYLKDPQAFAAKDERLAAQAKLFTLPMPHYGMLTPAQLESLAEFVVHRR